MPVATFLERQNIKKGFLLNEKRALREEYKDILRHISTERRFYAREALLPIIKQEVEPFCKVLSFVSLKTEIDLSQLNEHLLKEKKLYLSFSQAIEYDCILVPGLAFDQRGFRLGRGGGYYDKLLAIYQNVYTIGICFHEQITINNLPIEPHDKRVQKVCDF